MGSTNGKRSPLFYFFFLPKFEIRNSKSKFAFSAYIFLFPSRLGYHSSPYHSKFSSCSHILTRVLKIRSQIRTQILPLLSNEPKYHPDSARIAGYLTNLEEEFEFTFPIEVREFMILCSGRSKGRLPTHEHEFEAIIFFSDIGIRTTH